MFLILISSQLQISFENEIQQSQNNISTKVIIVNEHSIPSGEKQQLENTNQS
uniref:Uncharacterized protein n=1 Tax=Gossypium hirsutum TaxID=3635 RepID=A4GVG7_GOSHI|nr:unknown [Gossypium hirsutum]